MAKRRHAGTRAAGRSATARNPTPPTEPDPPPTDAPSAGRRRARDRDQELTRQASGRQSGLPSVAETAVYLSLAVVVAVIVLLANGRPWWHAAVVVIGATVAIIALKLVAGRTGSPAADAECGAGGARRRRRS